MKALSSSRIRLIAALAGLNIVLAAGGWLLLVGPQRHHAAAAAQQVQQTQSQIAQISASLANPPKPPTFHTGVLYQLAQAMPGTADEPDLLLTLDQLARSAGVRVLELSPASVSSAVGYSILPVSLGLQGSYASLTSFLHRLRTLVSVRHGKVIALGRLFSVKSISLAPASAGRGLRATVSLDVFVYGGPASATTAPGTTGTTSTTSTTTSGQ